MEKNIRSLGDGPSRSPQQISAEIEELVAKIKQTIVPIVVPVKLEEQQDERIDIRKSCYKVGEHITVNLFNINIFNDNSVNNQGQMTLVNSDNDQSSDDNGDNESIEQAYIEVSQCIASGHKKQPLWRERHEKEQMQRKRLYAYVGQLTRVWEVKKKRSSYKLVDDVYHAHGADFTRARIVEIVETK